mgnify:CR=1 FL=1
MDFRPGNDQERRNQLSEELRAVTDLVRIVSEQLEPGQQSTFEIVRDGKRSSVVVKLGERPRGPTSQLCS